MPSGRQKFMGVLEDAGLLLGTVLLFPVAILLIGTPLALLVQLVRAIASRLIN